MSDVIWETFDGLFKTLHRNGRAIEELTKRVAELEQRLKVASESTNAPDRSVLIPSAPPLTPVL